MAPLSAASCVAVTSPAVMCTTLPAGTPVTITLGNGDYAKVLETVAFSVCPVQCAGGSVVATAHVSGGQNVSFLAVVLLDGSMCTATSRCKVSLRRFPLRGACLLAPMAARCSCLAAHQVLALRRAPTRMLGLMSRLARRSRCYNTSPPV